MRVSQNPQNSNPIRRYRALCAVLTCCTKTGPLTGGLTVFRILACLALLGVGCASVPEYESFQPEVEVRVAQAKKVKRAS